MSGRIAARLAALGLELPAQFPPAGNYVGHRICGPLLFLAGAGPSRGPGEPVWTGKVGIERTLEEARAAAHLTVLNLLAEAKAALGDLDRVHRVVKLFGLVNAGPDFALASRVMDGASETLVAIFGEAGRHARTAVVAPALPVDITVEIDGVFEIG